MNERFKTGLSLAAEAVILSAYADKLRDRRGSKFVVDHHVPGVIQSIGLGYAVPYPIGGGVIYALGKSIEFGIIARKKIRARRSRYA